MENLKVGINNMKTAEEILKGNEPTCYEDVLLLMQEYADQSKWIDVNINPPKVGEHFTILVCGSYTRDCPQRATEVHYYKRGKFIEFKNMDGSRTKNVTHWQTMPAPPQS